MWANRARDLDVSDLDIVVVEESKPVQAIVRSILFAARVARVRVFDNAEDAYRSMMVEPPHLAVIAAELGTVDGITLVRTMRDPRSGPLVAVPVILTSHRPTRLLVERSIAAGVHFVIAKPLSPANVMRRIEAVIRDDRAFVFDERHGHHVLADHDELLAGQRERWQDLHGGARIFPVREDIVVDTSARERRRPAPAVPVPRPMPEEDVGERGPSRLLGLSVPLHEGPRETSTGQAAPRTA